MYESPKHNKSSRYQIKQHTPPKLLVFKIHLVSVQMVNSVEAAKCENLFDMSLILCNSIRFAIIN